MNIYTQVCGLIIIGLLLYFYQKQPTMGLSSEHRFITTLYSILGCVLLDIASCYFIVNSSRYNPIIVTMICKLYLASLQSVSFFALRYAVSDIIETLGSRHEKMLEYIYLGVYTIGIIITLYLPLDYYYDGNALYSYGISAILTYGFVAFYILTIIVVTILLKKHIKHAKITALLIWMAIWAFAAILQYIKPKLLIVSFAACIGALIMFFELENPQGAISRKTGHFSSAVIRDYFDYLYQHKKTFSVMMISFRTIAESGVENKMLRKTIEMLSDFLFNIEEAKVFDTAEGYFLLVFYNTDFMESTKFKIATYFQSVEDNPDIENAVTLLNPYYTVIPNCNVAEDADELMMLLSNAATLRRTSDLKNETIINTEAISQLRHRKKIEKLVIDAMENDRIEVHYQPIYNIATDSFTGAEALVRIRLADGSLIFPKEFIPIAEDSGRIIPLSDGIYKKTFSFIKSYRIERLGVERVELNLSVKQGESPVFVSRLLEQLKKNKISPELVNLEVTETSSLTSKEILVNNMKKLQEHGLTFSLDDFGSGNSNLNYIIDLPISIVKLDKHLTEEYFKNTKAKAIVKAVIEMAHSMKLKIIAEGIETKEEVEAMKTLGVDYIQGYYFSKPLPEHEYLKFIQTNNL